MAEGGIVAAVVQRPNPGPKTRYTVPCHYHQFHRLAFPIVVGADLAGYPTPAAESVTKLSGNVGSSPCR